MSRHLDILVPRFSDADNFNPQNQNAKSLLTRFSDDGVRWSVVSYGDPLIALSTSPRIRVTQLLPRHLWRPHLATWYQQPADAIFYPGPEWADEWGLRLRRFCSRNIPVISTIEGLVGTPDREQQLSSWAEHPVFCQRVDQSVLRRLDYIYKTSSHIIAISPFLGRMARQLYGDKVSVHMLGIEDNVFHTNPRRVRERPFVISVGAVRRHKRPEIFLQLAALFPEADFVWVGEGELRDGLTAEVVRRNLRNLVFSGQRSPKELAELLSAATIFAMPSRAEGVPKVTQEAAACGLPLVVFGHYETPTVVDKVNGFVVWSDVEFINSVKQLLSDPKLAADMGDQSTRKSLEWSWDVLAPEWEREILSRI